MRKHLFSQALLATALAAAGCSDSPAAPDAAELSRDDVALLAREFAATTSLALGGWFGLSSAMSGTASALTGTAAVPIDETFTRTHPCPRGGQVTVSGTIKGEVDRATRTLVTEINATKTQSACAIQNKEGVVITISGSPNLAIRSDLKIVNGAPSGLQTTTQRGAFTFSTSTGKTGACSVDLVSTFNPEAKTHSVQGSLCGRTVDVTRTFGQP